MLGGYLTWSENRPSNLLIYHQEFHSWEIQAPLYNVFVSCHLLSKNSWQLRVSAGDSLGKTAAPLILEAYYNTQEGFREKYRYSYPDDIYPRSTVQALEEEINQLVLFLTTFCKLVLATSDYLAGQLLVTNQVKVTWPRTPLSGPTMLPGTWQLKTAEGPTLVFLNPNYHFAEEKIQGDIYLDNHRLPAAHLAIDLIQASYQLKDGPDQGLATPGMLPYYQQLAQTALEDCLARA